jgi:type I protein arginine methyltransferase
VILSTAPDASGATHWGQLTFQLHPPVHAEPGDVLKCAFEMVRQAQNNRLLHVRLTLHVEGDSEAAQASHPQKYVYKID